jgi:hypothetical protein
MPLPFRSKKTIPDIVKVGLGVDVVVLVGVFVGSGAAVTVTTWGVAITTFVVTVACGATVGTDVGVDVAVQEIVNVTKCATIKASRFIFTSPNSDKPKSN